MDFVSASQPRILDTSACAFRTCCRFLNISMLPSAVRRQLHTASLDERDAFQFRYLLGVEARDLGVAEAARKWHRRSSTAASSKVMSGLVNATARNFCCLSSQYAEVSGRGPQFFM
eukprot:g8379.t1